MSSCHESSLPPLSHLQLKEECLFHPISKYAYRKVEPFKLSNLGHAWNQWSIHIYVCMSGVFVKEICVWVHIQYHNCTWHIYYIYMGSKGRIKFATPTCCEYICRYLLYTLRDPLAPFKHTYVHMYISRHKIWRYGQNHVTLLFT